MNTESSGTIKDEIEEKDCLNKNILILEDIYDSGNAMDQMIKKCLSLGAASV
jgi:hypoxanthine-guanine phosphoribosyltransferase